eukprot:TRINITY_DN5318_c0_g1_i1.p1 TRINITY_DN5318_c0_g1~~TRINITY_DN5318_c0_g1_i1.p1  ORF type:complete len:120 (+),score=28.30 TRINITY_DN5318_c0_g1_i1:29-361(+)
MIRPKKAPQGNLAFFFVNIINELINPRPRNKFQPLPTTPSRADGPPTLEKAENPNDDEEEDLLERDDEKEQRKKEREKEKISRESISMSQITKEESEEEMKTLKTDKNGK